uniref:COG1294 Cytochrome bd-type quinol oxidase, subunit 2 n=1 Tax=uncultured bacterium B3TF_MPn1 TaxID=1439866 RepID=W0NQE4_9BACT|nr:COG1294 Cytochrome bd-type quinol oxidase, subunit 2 [uncultured bacterium B3TF_MPn1]
MDITILPLIFFILMCLAVIMYAVLDGYDLGVGILMPDGNEAHRNRMIASIGPFWDANETWLVLAIGLLLIAFPEAYNKVLEALYLPVLIMLLGLILRGVSFDFRAKSLPRRKAIWDRLFKLGSLITALAQGYMLGRYMTGFTENLLAYAFACISALCVTAAYAYIGGAWLVMKCEGELQARALKWTRRCGWLMALGVILVSAVNLALYPDVYARWFENPRGMLLLPIPLVCMVLFFISDRVIRQMPFPDDEVSWLPFFSAASIFIMCFTGIGFSFFPYVIPGQIDIWEAASANESLAFLLYGAVFVIPAILFYTIFAYRVFWGKATDLEYY